MTSLASGEEVRSPPKINILNLHYSTMVFGFLKQPIIVSGTTPQIITVPPGSAVNIHAHGQGTITITFSTTPPSSLAQFTSGNTVTIPVIGELVLNGLTGVSQISFTGNLSVNVEQRAVGLIQIAPEIKKPVHSNISLTISSGTISAATVDNETSAPINILFVDSANIAFSGSGVSFAVSDYDPLANAPTGVPINVNLTGTGLSEYPSGSTLLQSRTGYIILSNITGTGTVNIYLTGGDNE